LGPQTLADVSVSAMHYLVRITPWQPDQSVSSAKEGSISFLKKRNKKLLFVKRHVFKRAKVSWFFFSKKVTAQVGVFRK
jgi:hypothetical protein